jgi:hypothetical protein
MFAYQMWADTTAGVMKLRNGANSAWITLYELDGTFVTTDIKLGLGTAAAPSLTFTGDLNTGIYSPGADQVSIATGGTQRVTVDASGRVGIGSAVPDTLLSVRNDTNDSPTINSQFVASAINSQLRFKTYSSNISASNTVHHRLVHRFDTNENNGYIDFFRGNALDGGFLGFGTSGSEKARIDASGRLLVGTDTARNTLFASGVTPSLQIEGTSPNTAAFSIVNSAASVNGATLTLAKQRSGSVGGNTLVNSGDELGQIAFQGGDGTNCKVAASIQAFVDTTPGANDMPGRLVFSTTADGAASPTERMRITSDGFIGFGTSTFGAGQLSTIRSTNYFNFGANNSNAFIVYNGSGVGVYLISGQTAWTANSDVRLKADLVPITDGLEKVGTLRAVTGRYTNDEEGISRSFLIAQEVQAVLPEAVSVAEDEDGTLGLRYTEVIPLLVAALKESKERIETLETKVAALEAK